MKVELSTLEAEVEYKYDGYDGHESAEVALRFGAVEVIRWPVPQDRIYQFSPEASESSRRYVVDDFVAGKLAALFGTRSGGVS